MVGGAEYTFYGVRGSNADVGLLVEYLYDAHAIKQRRQRRWTMTYFWALG